ncbi:hypothetical protein [Rhodopseudomonas pseudopalustris]|uniref:Uncharacterized protein n=1 Tax=Rhodopseudomonas pseudopalustris TaxID=1513892 RepID=A0A1H8WGH0_9BRAD|nr:hypothetical protein [Rhodopseudomonas pseudopalustris]SEP26527.1 hypothetical protein SAMN05444123_11260 [Rhodopseudomonas pseudopalustris]
MRKQTANVLCATGVGLLASLALTAIPGGDAQARECLTQPKGPAPAGSHWFYRTDHASKRNCWYLRAASEKSGKPTEAASNDGVPDSAAVATTAPTATRETVPADPAASPASAAALKTLPKPVRTTAVPLHSSIANARAEFQSPPEPAPMRDVAAQDAASQFPAPLPATSSAQQSDPSAEASQGSPIEQRWSDATSSDSSSANPALAADASTKLRTAAQAAVANGAAPATAALSSTGSASTLIIALLAALALAGVIVGGIVKFGRREPVVRRDLNGRPDIWGAAARPAEHDIAADRIDLDVDPSPPMQPTEPPSWIKAARQRQTDIKGTDEIEQLLSRAQKRPAA